jgi:tetratricopeptide (TPR) repeat protein
MNQIMRVRTSYISSPSTNQSVHEEFYLPLEVLEKIFSYMNHKTFLLARSISWMWEEASKPIWKDLYKQFYLVAHSIVDDKPDWKSHFIERNKLLKFHHLGIKKSKSLFKSSYDTNLNKGFEHLYRNELDKALDSFARATMERETARAFEGLTRIYYHKKMYAHVIVYSEACLKYSPINPGEILYMRGKALQGLGRLKEALCDINGSVHYLCLSHVKYMNLRAVEVYYDKMLLNITLGNFDLALKDCKKIEQIKTKTSEYSEDLKEDTYLTCAKILYDKKLFQQADRFLSVSPDKSQDFFLFCMKVQVAMGSYEDALDCFFKFEEKCKLDGNSMETLISHDTFLDIGITLFMNVDCKIFVIARWHCWMVD